MDVASCIRCDDLTIACKDREAALNLVERLGRSVKIKESHRNPLQGQEDRLLGQGDSED